LGDEFIGWGWHISVGALIMGLFFLVAHYKKWPPIQGFYIVATFAFFTEIGQISNERFFYFTPINYLLDFGFYLLGGFLFYSIWNYRKKGRTLSF